MKLFDGIHATNVDLRLPSFICFTPWLGVGFWVYNTTSTGCLYAAGTEFLTVVLVYRAPMLWSLVHTSGRGHINLTSSLSFFLNCYSCGNYLWAPFRQSVSVPILTIHLNSSHYETPHIILSAVNQISSSTSFLSLWYAYVLLHDLS